MSYTLDSTTFIFPYLPTGQVATSAWLSSRFTGAPIQGDPTPSGSADFGPTNVTPQVDVASGYVLVSATFETPDQSTYYLLFVDTNDGQTPNITYWSPLIEPRPHDSQQGWTKAAQYGLADRRIAQTTVAAGSNGAALPQATINVASASAFLSAGAVIWAFGVSSQLITYTGKSGTTLTGCSGGTGTMHTGDLIDQAFVNGPNRRTVGIGAHEQTNADGDDAFVYAYAVLGGSWSVNPLGEVSVVQHGSGGTEHTGSFSFPVDPNAPYLVRKDTNGTGSADISNWNETDF